MEAYTFYDILVGMGYDVSFVALDELHADMGHRGLNHGLERWAGRHEPDLLFAVLGGREVDPQTVSRVTQASETTTINWFCDDEFRFDSFSKRVAPAFDWVVTTDPQAPAKYAAAGYRNAVLSRWGHNPFLFFPRKARQRHDVSFVGQPIANRRALVQALKAGGVAVRTWGRGWDAGRVSHEDMAQVFRESRVNLNFAQTSVPAYSGLAWYVSHTWLHRAVNRLPGLRGLVKGAAKAVLARRSRAPAGDGGAPLRQLKARVFEVAASGGFLLTEDAPGLDASFRVGKEVAAFETEEELVDQVRRFLADDAERAAMARRAAARAGREHSMVHRLVELFQRAGVPHPRAEAVLQGRTPGVGRFLTPKDLVDS